MLAHHFGGQDVPDEGASLVPIRGRRPSGLQTANPSRRPHVAGGGRELSGVSFLRGTHPVREASRFPKALPLNTITLGVRASALNLRRDMQALAGCFSFYFYT